MPAMSAIASGCEPSSGVVRTLHEARYRAFLRLQALAHDVRKEIEPLLDAGPGGQAVQTK
jgi:D-ribulokinase